MTPSSSAKPFTLNRRTELVLNVFLAILGPLLAIGALEGVAYVWERAQGNGLYAWELVASRRIEMVSYQEPGAGYTLMKPNSHYKWQGIPVKINSHGLRGPETTFEKPANTVRILNLGDSVAMGWGVGYEETYGYQLQTLLNDNSNMNYEVINAGVPGWNLENALAYLQADGLSYEPDLIILDVTVVNDIFGKSALQKQNRPAVIEWLRTNTYFWPFLTVQMRWLEARAGGRSRIDVIDPPASPASYFPTNPLEAKWDNVWQPIRAMHDLAGEHGADFVVVLFPLEHQVVDETFPLLPQDVLTQRATAAGIPALDLLPTYRQACQQKPGGTCSLEDRYLFADVWMHPSAYGHTVTAAELHTFLEEILR